MRLIRIFTIIVLGIVLVSTVACSSSSQQATTFTLTPVPTTTEQLKSYSNEYFSVQYPSNWDLEVQTDIPEELSVLMTPESDFAYIHIQIDLEHADSPLSMHRDIWLLSLEHNSDDFILIDSHALEERWDWVLFYEFTWEEEWYYGQAGFKCEPEFVAIVIQEYMQDNVEMENECSEIISSISFK